MAPSATCGYPIGYSRHSDVDKRGGNNYCWGFESLDVETLRARLATDEQVAGHLFFCCAGGRDRHRKI
jgi:hypothetical protein